jgi:2-polyprenyl-6-methoxyphenol hydroxylase-like FAD-dependent oxidoreductase
MTTDDMHYDAIVVGARCAGSPTAMLLARQGHRVLLVDRATFPSDTPSTHMLHAPAIDALRRWGLLDQVVATGCPAVESYSFDFGPITISGSPLPMPDGEAIGYAPRRTVLDKILVDAAAEASVDVREGFTVDEILSADGRVTGIRGRDSAGTTVTAHAQVVIGADGVHSQVAQAVGAAEYQTKPMLQWGAYTYWRDLPVSGMETYIRPDRGFAAIPTNDDLTLVVVGWPIDEAPAYRADIEGNYLATIELVPQFAERVRAATRADRFHGGGVPNVFRVPFGPGWVLVGDAGYAKDPITAQGILDAFADAERCATALDEVFRGTATFDDAMAAAQATRDQHAMPIYEFTTGLATLAPPPPEMQQLLGAIVGNQPAMDGFVSVVAGTVSPAVFFDPANLEGLLSPSAV